MCACPMEVSRGQMEHRQVHDIVAIELSMCLLSAKSPRQAMETSQSEKTNMLIISGVEWNERVFQLTFC